MCVEKLVILLCRIFFFIGCHVHISGVTQSFDDICIHCGDIEVTTNQEILELKEAFGIVRPICQSCLRKGLNLSLKLKKPRRN